MDAVIRNTWYAKRSDCTNIFVRIITTSNIFPTFLYWCLLLKYVPGKLKLNFCFFLSSSYMLNGTPFLWRENLKWIRSALKWIRIPRGNVLLLQTGNIQNAGNKVGIRTGHLCLSPYWLSLSFLTSAADCITSFEFDLIHKLEEGTHKKRLMANSIVLYTMWCVYLAFYCRKSLEPLSLYKCMRI